MGQFRDVDQMFHGVNYNRFTSAEVRTAMQGKVDAVSAKIRERAGRLAKIMAENDISDAMATDMVLQYMRDRERGQERVMYSNTARPRNVPNAAPREINVPAGIVSNLVTEKGLIETETAEVNRMILILRNLKDEEYYFEPRTGARLTRPCIHTLTDTEIEYLGI